MDTERRTQAPRVATRMLLPSSGWLLMVAMLCGAVALSTGADLHSIPPHLLDCYQNASVFHRENRLPATMESVVELIRKVERWPDFRMDLRTFSLSLLYMFRLDGVERDPDIFESAFVIPYSPSGDQYYKHRLLMDYVVKYLAPTTGYTFPNESLSLQQKCSLHFMMSNSIDDTDRGDDSTTCSVIHAQRRRRDVGDVTDDDNDLDRDYTDYSADPADPAPRSGADSLADGEVGPLDDVETVDSSQVSPAAPPAPKPAAASVVPPISSDVELIDSNSTSDGDHNGDMKWGSDGDPGTVPISPSRQTRVEKKSTCPVENGVVRTRWGSVHLGTLLAGVAAGMNRETISLNDLRKQLPTRNQDVDRALEGRFIDNLWAATLAGDLAEVALAQGPKSGSGSSITVGAAGNWNNTQAPRWYFINKVNLMTDAEIRGGIDGLIIGNKIQDWYQTWNRQLSLSTLLERYYSNRGVIGEDDRACKRQDHFAGVAPEEETKQQTFNFAYLLMDQNPKVVSISREGVEHYADQAVQALIRYVPTDIKENCDSSYQYTEDKYGDIVPVVDLNVIFDCSWEYNKVSPFFENFASMLNLDEVDPGSSITIFSGNDLKVLVNTTKNYTGFSANLRNNETEFKSCSGMNLKNILENNLWEYYTNDIDRQKNDTDLRINSKVLMLMPGPTYDLTPTESDEVKKLLTEYRTHFPDVKFLIFAPSHRENFKNIVEEKEDIILFGSIDTITSELLIKRLKEVPRRISNPTCGSTWEERTYGPYSHMDSVGLNQTTFYRINSKYLYGVGSETIKVREDNTGGTIKVCYSRTQKYPLGDESVVNNEKDDADDGDVTCETVNTGGTLEIKLDKPCKGQSNFMSCHSLYISVKAVGSKYQCQNCNSGDDVRVTITHSQLTCGVGAFLANPIILAITALLGISKIFFT